MPVVYTAANPVEAHLCQQYLESQGIKAVVDGEILWMSRGEFPLNEASYPRVSVSPEDFERAEKLIADFQSEPQPSETLEPWTCPNCEEENPADYEICWNCQTVAPQAETPM